MFSTLYYRKDADFFISLVSITSKENDNLCKISIFIVKIIFYHRLPALNVISIDMINNCSCIDKPITFMYTNRILC